MYPLIIFVASAFIVLFLKAAFDKSIIKKPDRVLKILAVTFCVVGIFRFLLSDSFVETVFGGADPFQSILRWCYHIGYAVLPMSVFFDSRLFRNIASYFSLPVALLSAIFFEDTMAYFLAPGAGGFYITSWVRYTYYILELVLAISLPILMQINSKHVINIRSAKEVLTAVGIIPLIMIQMMPSYIPISLIEKFDIGTGMFGGLHLLWLVCLVAEAILLYFIFRKRSEKEKYMLIVFLVIAQVMHTTSPMIRGFTFSRLPLQLCNIAAFFYLYMIIKRDRKIFDFCYLANLVGAAIAMILVSFSSDALSFWNIHYIYEHSFVVLVPILAFLFGIFPRLDRSAIKHMITCYTIYFAFIFVFGTVVNGLDQTPNFFPVNHFYMFDPAVAVKYLPFVGFTGAVHWEFGGFEVYPILVVTIYVIFMLLNLLFYAFTRGLYKISDVIRAKKEKKEPALQAKEKSPLS